MAARKVCRLATEAKKKKDEEKKRAHKKMLACDSLEKHRRAQVREGLLLKDSPSTEEDDDDDDEGTKFHMGFCPKAGPRSAPALVGPSSDAVPFVQGPAASLSGAQASAKPAPVLASAEEAGPWKGKSPPSLRKPAWCLRVRRPEPLSGRRLR
jgi:hypothetical protein